MYDPKELRDLFRRAEGMRRLAEIRCNAIVIGTDPPVPFDVQFDLSRDPFEIPFFIEQYIFTLQALTLGVEKWAYISCAGIVIVPPFPWKGHKSLTKVEW